MDPNTQGHEAPNHAAMSRQARRTAARKESKLVEEWKARRTAPLPSTETTLLTLPSGDKVRAKRLGAADMIALRQMPNRFIPVILQWIESIKAAPTEQAGAESIAEAIQKDVETFFGIITHTWLACVVEPKFVPDEEYKGHPGTLPMMWVAVEDMQYLFDWAQGVDESVVEWFLRRQNENMASAQKSLGLQDLTGPTTGNNGPMAGVSDERGSTHLGRDRRRAPKASDGESGTLTKHTTRDASGKESVIHSE